MPWTLAAAGRGEGRSQHSGVVVQWQADALLVGRSDELQQLLRVLVPVRAALRNYAPALTAVGFTPVTTQQKTSLRPRR